jgi:hypothetical protein
MDDIIRKGDLAMLVRGLCSKCDGSPHLGVPFMATGDETYYVAAWCTHCNHVGPLTLVGHPFHDASDSYFPRPCVIKIKPLSAEDEQERAGQRPVAVV